MDQDQSDKVFCKVPLPHEQPMDNPGTRISPTSHFAKCLSPMDSPWIIQGPGSVQHAILQSTSLLHGWSMDNPGTRISLTSHFATCLSPMDSPWIISGLGPHRIFVLHSFNQLVGLFMSFDHES